MFDILYFRTQIATMKKNLLFIVCSLLVCISSIKAQDSAPRFTAGRTQSLSVCENSGLVLNTALSVMDSDVSQTETWSTVYGGAHGTLLAGYTTTSTGATLTPTGLSYTPATGFIGMDTVTIQVSDGTLADSTTIYITVNALPVAGTISGATAVCVGGTTTLTESVSGGFWSMSNGNADIVSSGIVTGITGGLDTVNYFVVNTCGTAVATYPLTITALPVAGSISGGTTVCIGGTDTLTDAAGSGTWTASNSNASVSGGIVSGATAGTDSIIYTVSNTCGTATTSRVITISSIPSAGTITGSRSVCAGSSATFTESVSGGLWSASNGAATVTGGVVSGAYAGVDTILYFVSNSCGTTHTSFEVSVLPLPAAGMVSGPSTICTGATGVYVDTVAGGIWSVTNGNATNTDSLLTGVSMGMDTVSYSVTNACGTSSAQLAVMVAAVPHAGPITGPTGVCTSGSITLSVPASGGTWVGSNSHAMVSGDTISGVTYGLDTISYRLSNTCGADTAIFVIRVDTVAPGAGVISGLPVLCTGDSIRMSETSGAGYWSVTNTSLAHIGGSGRGIAIAPGTDTVVYTVINGCGTATAIYGIAINPRPSVEPISGYDSVCAGSTIALTDPTPGGSWLSANPFFASVDASGNVRGALHGTATILYILSNSCGSDTTAHAVNINIPAQPITTVPSIFCQGSTTPVPLIGTPSGGNWSSENPLVVAALPFAGGVAIGLTIGTTELIYTVNNACGTTTDSTEVSVVNCAGLEVATVSNAATTPVISPNPSNGTFSVTLPGSIASATVTVTNILGEKVKELTVTGNTEIQLNSPAGIYFLTTNAGGQQWIQKIVVNQ